MQDAGPAGVIAYIRVSTEEQGREGYSVEAQGEVIEQHAARMGLPVRAKFLDIGISGGAKVHKREGLLSALGWVRENDVLMVARRDRLARDRVLAAWFDKEVIRRGGRVISCAGEGTGGDQDDPTSMLLSAIVDAFAEYERLVISFRTKAGLRMKRSKGEWTGQPRFGFRAAGKGVEVDERETAVADFICQTYSGLEYKTLAEVEKQLNIRGMRPRHMRWNAKRVLRMLREDDDQEADVKARVIAKGPDIPIDSWTAEHLEEAAKMLNAEGLRCPGRWSRIMIAQILEARGVPLARRVGRTSPD